jgi:hypothetical protein
MYARVLLVLTAASAIFASAHPVLPRSLPTSTVTCGSNSYSPSELTAAINAGIEDMDNGNLQGAYHSVDAWPSSMLLI